MNTYKLIKRFFCKFLCKHFGICCPKPKPPGNLSPATNLKQQFIAHKDTEMSKETYNLNWLQSAASVANTQDVLAVVDGVTVVLAQNLLMTSNSLTFDFDTDASVDWFVRTWNADKSKSDDSVHSAFIATNEEPLTPATNLSQVWVAHIP